MNNHEFAMQRGTELAGKVALVTGSSRNIGRASALALAAGGAKVAVIARASLDEAKSVAAEIRGLGTESEAFLADNAELRRANVRSERDDTGPPPESARATCARLSVFVL